MLDVKQPKILMFDVIEGKILVFSVFEIPPSRPSVKNFTKNDELLTSRENITSGFNPR